MEYGASQAVSELFRVLTSSENLHRNPTLHAAKEDEGPSSRLFPLQPQAASTPPLSVAILTFQSTCRDNVILRSGCANFICKGGAKFFGNQ